MTGRMLGAALLASGLLGCGQAPPGPPPEAVARGETQPVAATPATASGAPVEVAAAAGDHPEASVTQVVGLNGGAKLYSTAGGDPAINGLYTYIARLDDPSVGWRVFQIGDFNAWRVVEDRGETVVLSVSRSWVDDAGEIQTAEELKIVSVPNEASTAITVTPAR